MSDTNLSSKDRKDDKAAYAAPRQDHGQDSSRSLSCGRHLLSGGRVIGRCDGSSAVCAQCSDAPEMTPAEFVREFGPGLS